MESKIELIRNSLDDWQQALRLFSKSTNLITSMYLPDGTRIAGPYTFTPFGKFLVESGKFRDEELCNYCEKREVIKVSLSAKNLTFDFSRSLRIDAIPVKDGNKVLAVIMTGWVFDHFPDPLECEHIARNLSVSGNRCWQLARLQAPVSSEKFQIFEEMLNMLTTTLLEQISANQKLKEAMKMKDDLLNIVSHELKTPLTSILLRIQMLKSGKFSPEKLNHFLSSMEQNAKLEAKLIDDLLDSAKMLAGKFYFETKNVDLCLILQHSIDMVIDLAENKEISIEYQSELEKAPFKGDDVRLTQLFVNLLHNSIKFTPEKGRIEITLRKEEFNYLIVLKDSGIGIEKGFLPHIFEIFKQGPSEASNVKSGLGLGLSLVKKIVDHYHGKIEVNGNEESSGTTFSITLPI